MEDKVNDPKMNPPDNTLPPPEVTKVSETAEEVYFEIAKKLIAIPENKPEHAADHKLRQTAEIVKRAMQMAERKESQKAHDEVWNKAVESCIEKIRTNLSVQKDNDSFKRGFNYARNHAIAEGYESKLRTQEALLQAAEDMIKSMKAPVNTIDLNQIL